MLEVICWNEENSDNPGALTLDGLTLKNTNAEIDEAIELFWMGSNGRPMTAEEADADSPGYLDLIRASDHDTVAEWTCKWRGLKIRVITSNVRGQIGYAVCTDIEA